MHRLKSVMAVFCLVMMMLLPMQVSAEEADQKISTTATEVSAKRGLVKENGKYYYYDKNGNKIKNHWKKIDGERYYFYTDGHAVTNSANIDGKARVFNSEGHLLHPEKKGFYKAGKNTYYVYPNGEAATGWFRVNDRLFCADFKGRLYKNKTFEGIYFTYTGNVRVSTNSKLKLLTMEIVDSITNDKMSKSQKLRACWNYLVYSGRFRYREFEEDTYSAGWQKKLAYNMLTTHSGNCTSFAVAFAALADEVGYDPYILYTRIPGSRDQAPDGYTRHCWVTIDGCHYDPEGTWAGWISEVYGRGYYPLPYQTLMYFNYAKTN